MAMSQAAASAGSKSVAQAPARVLQLPQPAAADVTRGNIARIRKLLGDADMLDGKALCNSQEARRYRIEAGRLMVKENEAGTKWEAIYKDVGLFGETPSAQRKSGVQYQDLARLYPEEEFGKEELDKRQAEGHLLSLGAAHQLQRSMRSKPTDAAAILRVVRDGPDAGTFGPEAIKKVSGDDDDGGKKESLRDELRKHFLGIDGRIAELKEELNKKSPLPEYGAEFLDADTVRIKAGTLPLVYAALTRDPETAIKALNFFFSQNGEYEIRRIKK